MILAYRYRIEAMSLNQIAGAETLRFFMRYSAVVDNQSELQEYN
jgi:hypothetical protein